MTVAVARALPALAGGRRLPPPPGRAAGPTSTTPSTPTCWCAPTTGRPPGRSSELIDRLPGLRGVDAGGLASALAIEALTPALLEVNRRYKTHAAVRITGLPLPDRPG